MHKKLFVLLTVLLLSALVLAACGGDEETPTPEPVPTEAQQQSLSPPRPQKPPKPRQLSRKWMKA